MFCPKCGTQNPTDGRFCRKCGTNLGTVSDVLSGKTNEKQAGWGTIQPIKPIPSISFSVSDSRDIQDPDEIYGSAITQILTGIGFLIVAVALLTTGIAGGKAWWWAMLFPAFGSLGKGVADYMKSRRMEQRQMNVIPKPNKAINDAPANSALPPTNADYVPTDFPDYQTGDLVAPPSVVENTTRRLEMDSEGETMTLPKSNL